MTRPLTLRPPTLRMETDLLPVAGGAQAGWVSGTPAGLAANATGCAYFDLSPDWDQYPYAQLQLLSVGPSTGLGPVQLVSADAIVGFNASRRLGPAGANGSTIYASIASAGGPQSFVIRPQGRYLLCQFVNGDAGNAQGAAAKLILSLHIA